MNTQRVFGLFVAATMAVGMIAVPFGVSAHAAQGLEDFDPNNLMSDEAMYGAVSQSMSEEDISAFLADKGKRCVRGKDGSACIKDARFNTQSFPASQWCPEPYQGADNESAAAVIAKSARACQISPKVLLVLLQKEQGLIQTTNPTKRAFDRATGFACPDTAPCDPSKAGFATQVYAAASRLQQYKAQPHRFNFAVGRTTRIGYHPNASCGFTTVTPKTAATAALYNYTPYVPNAAALANPYGSGDSCSAYGNRNFFRIHSDWFGRPNEVTVTEEPTPTPQPQPTPQPAPQPSPEPKPEPAPEKPEVLGEHRTSFDHDLTGDGIPDLLLPGNGDRSRGEGWGNGSEMHVVEIAQNGRSEAEASYRAIGWGWRADDTIDAGDWTGDGYRDLMLVSTNGDLLLYPGNTNFTWRKSRVVGYGWSGMDVIFGGADFDGDQKPDLLARQKNSGRLYLYRGDGRGAFQGSHVIGWGWSGMKHLALVPGWNGHLAAVVAVRSADGKMFVYPSDGRGHFAGRVDFPGSWNHYKHFAGISDQNADHRGDLAAVTTDGKIQVLPLDRHSVGSAWSVDIHGARVERIFPAGLNNTRFLNAILSDARLVNVDRTTMTNKSISTGIVVKQGEKLLKAGQWDADSYPDLIIWNNEKKLLLHRGNGKNSWDHNGQIIGVGWGFTDVIPVKNWKARGASGMLAFDQKSGLLRLYTADANGYFNHSAIVAEDLQWADMIADAGSWSGQAGPEIFARESNNGRLYWIGSDPNGMRVHDRRSVGHGWSGMKTLSVGNDMNRDGLDDVLALRHDGKLFLYQGTGHPYFGSVQELNIKK